MKSSISMKSCKTTISLSALLFLLFALTVFSWSFIDVSMPSSSSSPASPARATYSPTNQSFYQMAASAAGPENFTIIALPDTQFYSESYPALFDNQTLWMANNTQSMNIEFVTHEGDIVNNGGQNYQWINANRSLSKLDGYVPWAVLPATHDDMNPSSPSNNYANYNTYFPYSRFRGNPWYGGAYNNINTNNYELFTGGFDDYLIFHFQYHPTDAILQWANDTITAYPNRRVIVTTHDYMNVDGSRTTEGDRIWDGFVAPHANQVFLVLCGHNHGEARRTDAVNGHTVYQLLADYQSEPNGGNGWLRILQFRPAQDKVLVKTFSPYLNSYASDADSEFTFDYEMTSSPASPANGSITYDAPSNTMTVVGGPYNFTDVYNADVAGGWGVTHLQGIAQFKIDAKLVFGDGSTTTTFSATNVQILQTNVAVADGTIIVRIENAATVTLGSLEDATAKTTQDGVIWMVDGQNTWYRLWFQADTGAVLNVYSSLFQYVNARTDTQGLYIKSASSTNRIWNTMLTGYKLGLRDGTADHYNVYISEASYALNNQGGTFQNIFLYKGGITWWTGSTVTITNLFSRRSFNANTFDHFSDQSQYLVNPDVDSWTFSWRGYYGPPNYAKVFRQYTFDLKITDKDDNAISGATVTLRDKNTSTVFSITTNASGDIATQTVSRGYYDQANGNTLQDYSPHTLTITKAGYQTYTGNFALSQKTNWTIALQPLTDGGLIEHVGFIPVDPGLTSPSGTYRWLDVADQAYGIGYRNSYNYSQAAVEVAYSTEGNKLQGLLKARNLKPNFAYQLKLVGTPGTADNERIGLTGRWWQEEWTGTTWANGQNLNNKGDGSSPNPNDQTYLSRRYIQDSSSPTGYHYRYTGYLVFNYFITDSNGTATLQFETGSSYHVIWKTTQLSNGTNDGPVKTVTFDPAPSQPAYDTDYPSNTVSIFGEWERLPMGQVNLQPGEYNCQIVLTEESFHGSGGTLAGNWAGAVTANIMFTVN